MAKQTINIGIEANDRRGDPIRVAFAKINSNFTELYDIETTTDNEWESSSNTLFSTVDWISGNEIEIVASNTEIYALIAFDARSESNSIYFEWDQEFITDVWEGFDHPIGEGESFEISLNGTDWFIVEKSGYSSNSYFYFSIPFEQNGAYTFTYTLGQEIQIRFNRGSLPVVWFDLVDAPVAANTVLFTDMNVVAEATVISSNGSISSATQYISSLIFPNVTFNDDTGEGMARSTDSVFLGASDVEDVISIRRRIHNSEDDAGKLYGVFTGGKIGSMTIYWNAKLYTKG